MDKLTDLVKQRKLLEEEFKDLVKALSPSNVILLKDVQDKLDAVNAEIKREIQNELNAE